MIHPAGLPPRLAEIDRTLVWGVLNVTPDSFSDGGSWLDPVRAVEHARALARDGADVIDVGGESTRPGADRVPASEELARVVPVIEQLVADGIPVSIDTMRAEVAAAAVAAGACIVNDVSGGLSDPEMRAAVAQLPVPYVVMHWRGYSANMDELAMYDDVVAEVLREVGERVDEAVAAGVARERVVVDPGIGFAKQVRHNWPLLASVDRLSSLGCPVLIGASRKRFLGAVLADATGSPRDAVARDDATHAVSALMAAQGVWAVRVHEARGSADAVRVGAALRAARSEASGG